MGNEKLILLLYVGITGAFVVATVLFVQLYKKKVQFGYATNGKRLLALFFDLLLLHFVWIVPLIIYYIISGDFKYNADAFFQSLKNRGWVLLELQVLGFYCLYSLLFEYFFQATIGQQWVELQVRNKEDGGKPGLQSIVFRNVFKYISIVLVIPLIYFSFTSKSRRWLHDLVGGTVVVDLQQANQKE